MRRGLRHIYHCHINSFFALEQFDFGRFYCIYSPHRNKLDCMNKYDDYFPDAFC